MAALEEEAIGLIQPSRMPGSMLFEEAVHFFATRARAQMSTADPALVTYDMAVSFSLTSIFNTTLSSYFSACRRVLADKRPRQLL